MSFDSTCTEETNSSSGACVDSQNYYHSSHRVLTTRHTQPHAKGLPHDLNIFDKFLEEKGDSGISNGPNEDLEIEETTTCLASSSAGPHGQNEDTRDFNGNRKLSRRGRLQRSTRIQEEEYTPRKKPKAISNEEDDFDFKVDENAAKNINNRDDKPTQLKSVKDNNKDSTNGTQRPTFSSISPGSFEALDNDEEDVAYIDEDVEERDLHGDLLNWLTLSDAPKQGQDEVDL